MNRHLTSSARVSRQRPIRHAAADAVEMLESRQMLTANYFNLSAGSLSQNWENAGQLTVNDDWSGVPSIEGYDGAGVVTTTGANPTTLTAATPTGAIDVTVDSTAAPSSISAAGVYEFALSSAIGTSGSNTVALQPGNAAQAPYLRFYVNSTGVGAVRVKLDLIDVDAGTSTNAQPVALQYRTDPAGTWRNAPDGYVADASDFAGGLTGKVSTINSLLPADAANQPTLQLRVITANAVGNDQFIAVDNIVVSADSAPVGPGTIAVDPTTFTVGEGVGTFNVTLTRSNGSTGAVSATYTLLSGTAVAGTDFTGPGGLLTGTVNFADGATTAVIPVTITQDHFVEGAENFTVALSNATGGAALGANGTVNITDDDVAGTFTLNPTTYTVNENAGTVTLTVTRTGGTADAVTVSYATTDGTAVSGSDYTGTTNGTVSFVDGQTSGTFTIPILNDSIGETLENFTVALTGATNTGVVGTAVATVTINDDDTRGTLSFDPATYTVNEAAGTVTLTVKRTGGTTGAVSANYALVAGTATSPADFNGPGGVLTGTVSFAEGVDTATIVVSLVDDTLVEGTENFTATLSSPTGGATIGTTPATISITDNDFNVPTGLLINEIFIDPPTANTPYQFVEIKGTPGTKLDNVFIFSLEGDSADNPGTVDGVIDLTGAVIGSNGLLLVKANTGGFTPSDPATTVFNTTFFDAFSPGIGFEVATSSYLLAFRDPTGADAPIRGTDLDADNTSTPTGNFGLEGLPSNFTLLDGIANYDGGATDVTYGPSIAPINTNAAADAIVRFNGNTTPFSAAAFYDGLLVDNSGLGTGSTTLTFGLNANQRSSNFPEGGIVTPGGANAPVPNDTTAPTVTGATFSRVGSGPNVTITFSEDIRNAANGVTASDFTLVNNTTGATIPTSSLNVVVASDGKSVVVSFNNVSGAAASMLLPNGNYTLTLAAGGAADVAGNPLASSYGTSFGFVNGDATGSSGTPDNAVNFSDLLILAQNYGKTSGGTYATGDLNYDGAVNFSDLLLLAQNYGVTLPQPAMFVAVSSSKTSSVSSQVLSSPAPAKASTAKAPAPSTKR